MLFAINGMELLNVIGTDEKAIITIQFRRDKVFVKRDARSFKLSYLALYNIPRFLRFIVLAQVRVTVAKLKALLFQYYGRLSEAPTKFIVDREGVAIQFGYSNAIAL